MHKIKLSLVFKTIIVLLVIIFVLTIIMVAYHQAKKPSPFNDFLNTKEGKYCLAQGGTIDVRSGGKDGKFAVCIINGKAECELNKFFLGSCQAKPVGETKPPENKQFVWGNLRFTVPDDWQTAIKDKTRLVLTITNATNITLDVFDSKMLDILRKSFIIKSEEKIKIGEYDGLKWTGNTPRSSNDVFESFLIDNGQKIYFLRTNVFGMKYLDQMITSLTYDSNAAGLQGDACGLCSSGLTCSGGKCE